MTLFYCPLEGYKERYTMQWSAPKTGWLERNWIKAGVEYVRIDNPVTDVPRSITAGVVLDAVGRSVWAMDQISRILVLMETGVITSTDTIYFDDFWHPGMEAIAYAGAVLGVRPRMYAFLHAQSVDQYDFTHPMRSWMRHFEKGNAAILDGIFVCCPSLKELLVEKGIAPEVKIHVTGHPFNSQEVMERMPDWYKIWMGGKDLDLTYNGSQRKNRVIWSSRWDAEKQPQFFMQVAERVWDERPDVTFEVCTSSKSLRSNNALLLRQTKEFAAKHHPKFQIHEGLSKEAYYQLLVNSKVQFNCALQDWVAITLLEASVAGCVPVYPAFRSFPETFLNDYQYMYEPWSVEQAARKILNVCEGEATEGVWSRTGIKSRAWMHDRFDLSWLRQLAVMNVPTTCNVTEEDYYRALLDPFSAGDVFTPDALGRMARPVA